MSGYHYAQKIEVTDIHEPLLQGFRWIKAAQRPPYCVHSDGGGLTTRHEDAQTLTQARKLARERARECGWAEVFRWAETGTQLRRFFVTQYERELKV